MQSSLINARCRMRHGVVKLKIFTNIFYKFAKVTQAAYKEDFVEVPTPFFKVTCTWGYFSSQLSVHYSRKEPVCSNSKCKKSGTCKTLLESNEWLCE